MIYLFSPVGNTDPIKYFHDGSLVHICRVYKPDIVYLYMSKEILEHHNKDNRYVKTLEHLSQKLQHSFEIRLIERPDLVNVQRYDEFYLDFQREIKRIEAEMKPEDRLLVNTASGTPAMKSALNIMAALAEYRFTPIQVSTPMKKSNLEYEEREDYESEINWDLNEDNKDEYVNRCYEVHSLHLLSMLKKDMIKKHLGAYDYRAALRIAKEIEEDLPKGTLSLLKAADARLSLDWETFNKQGVSSLDAFCPVRDGAKRRLFEYTLGLKIKIKKGEYADFIRAITPLMLDLLELVLKQYCQIDIDDYCIQRDKNRNNNVKEWDADKLKNSTVLNALNGAFKSFRSGIIYSAHLNAIIQQNCGNNVLKRRIQEMSDVERKIRNIAAHDIVSVTDKWVMQEAGLSIEKILEHICYICGMVKINTKEENWDSYDRMNQYIIERI